MKALTFSLNFALACVATVSAQDTLFLNSGKLVPCKILDVGTDAVKFHKFEKPDGPLYSVSRSQLAAIHYADGSQAFLEDAPATTASSLVAVHVAGMEDQFIPEHDNTVYNPPKVEPRNGGGAQLLAALFILGATINHVEKQKQLQQQQNRSAKCCCSSYSRCSHHK